MERPNSSPERANGSTKDEVKGPSQKKARTRGRWTRLEDEKLKRLVEESGHPFSQQNWDLHARQLEGRSGKSCRLRWEKELDPRINKAAFTERHEMRLLGAHALLGDEWSLIAELVFPLRTGDALEMHWNVLMEKMGIYEKTGDAKRKKEMDGGYTRFPAEEASIGCRSINAKPGSKRKEPSVNTSWNYSQDKDKMCKMKGVGGNTAMSTGTKHGTSSNNMPHASASELHGRDTSCHYGELIVECNSPRGKSSLTANNLSRGQVELIITGVRDNTSMSTGTENDTSSKTVPEASASELHWNHEEREVGAPCTDYMAIGSVDEREVTVPLVDFMGVGSVDEMELAMPFFDFMGVGLN
ncbi:hypothetical protein LUZ62_038254 [Rhynchospora pubera]|uniref:Uncharacterized protein n=1 Tax=Rhynchospora pubera TaxID=906938 RepID=A0AAV8F8H5_9POAL|nr:hypothetical protein LUZ62_038254 [Rhynchospora pubera]